MSKSTSDLGVLVYLWTWCDVSVANGSFARGLRRVPAKGVFQQSEGRKLLIFVTSYSFVESKIPRRAEIHTLDMICVGRLYAIMRPHHGATFLLTEQSKWLGLGQFSEICMPFSFPRPRVVKQGNDHE